MRAFCAGLRAWDAALFGGVDFKVTDGLKDGELFKALTVRKTDELAKRGAVIPSARVERT